VVAQHFKHMDRLMEASETEMASIPGVGPVCGHSIFRWFQDTHNRGLITQLKRAGLTMEEQRALRPGPLAGQSFLFTGRLTSMPRSAAEEAIEQRGGMIASSVSRHLNHLIIGEDPGSKLAKARQAGVPTHDEQWFLTLLQQPSQEEKNQQEAG
jgi:DNA ligase (NAD+)